MLSRFKWAILIAILGILLGGVTGMLMSTLGVLEGFLIGVEKTATLSVVESSMSLDNAIVVSALLVKLNEFWRKMYATVGLIIGILVMRFSFPILIVSFSTHINPWDTLMMAIHHPMDYSSALNLHKHEINAFGSSFLLLLALHFFMNQEKEDHWLSWIERPLHKLGAINSLPVMTVVAVNMVSSMFIPSGEQASYIFSGLAGVVGYYLVKDVLGYFVGDGNGKASAVNGLAMFLYIECIDGSFSFDGVIGAFAITDNIFQIAIGLGIGSMFIRVFTKMIVEGSTLTELVYLEPGAFLTILVLSIIMVIENFFEVPGYITGVLSVALIGGAFWSSLRALRVCEL